MSGTRNGTGREAGSSQVEGLETRPTELARDGRRAPSNASWVQSWKSEEHGTVMAGCRRWNTAGSRKLWSVVGIIYLEAHLDLGLVRVWSWGCVKVWDLLETSDAVGT